MDQVSAAGGLVSAELFLQGETDAAKQYKAQQWRGHFEEMLAGLRATFGPELPVIRPRRRPTSQSTQHPIRCRARRGRPSSTRSPTAGSTALQAPPRWRCQDFRRAPGDVLAAGSVRRRYVHADDHHLEQDAGRHLRPHDRRHEPLDHAHDARRPRRAASDPGLRPELEPEQETRPPIQGCDLQAQGDPRARLYGHDQHRQSPAFRPPRAAALISPACTSSTSVPSATRTR